MTNQERARFIASLTDDELRQLRGRLKDPDARAAGDKGFAANFFSGSDDGDDQDDGDKDGEYTDEQRQWAKELFSILDDGSDVLPGLSGGRTTGRTTPDRRDSSSHSDFRYS